MCVWVRVGCVCERERGEQGRDRMQESKCQCFIFSVAHVALSMVLNHCSDNTGVLPQLHHSQSGQTVAVSSAFLCQK